MAKKYKYVIEAGKNRKDYWVDLWNFKELFFFLAWKDILIRYKQTVIGVAWAVIRPVMTMIVLTVVFGKLAKMPSEGTPYPVLVFSAVLPWQLFASSFTMSSDSIINNQNLVSKIYFPRIILPGTSIIVSLVDFLISFSILIVLMIVYGIVPGVKVLILPLLVLLVMMVSFGAGLWISALNVKYRDFKHLIPFMVQLGLYISPVGFNSSIVPEKWRMLYSLNPMVGVIDGFRWALLGNTISIYWPGFFVSIGFALLLLITGFLFFRKTERTFADYI